MKRLYETPVVMQMLYTKEDILLSSSDDAEAQNDNVIGDGFLPL